MGCGQPGTTKTVSLQEALPACVAIPLTYLLREMVSRQGGAGAGWRHAGADPQIHGTLAQVHDDNALPGTLEGLAQREGRLRSGLAERFREAMGDPPLSDLRSVSGSARGALAAAAARACRDSGARGPRPTRPTAAARRPHRTPPTAVPLAARPTPAPA